MNITHHDTALSKRLPIIGDNLEELFTDLCGVSVDWGLWVFPVGADHQGQYVISGEGFMPLFRPWLDAMEEQLRTGVRVDMVPPGHVSSEGAVAVATHLREIAKVLEEICGDAYGSHVHMTLVVFPDGLAQYASNAERESVITALREWLGYIDAGMPHVPAHHKQ